MERIGGRGEVRVRLANLLAEGGHSTSTQVLREWNRIVLAGLVRLRNVLPAANDRTDIVARMREGAFGRDGVRRWQVTEWVMGSDSDLKVVEMRAAHYQRIRARAQFKMGIATVRDGTECGVAVRKPYVQGGTWRYDEMCKKSEDICVQPSFLEEHRTRALDAAKALEGSDRPGDRDMGVKAKKNLEDLDVRATKGKACHGGGGLGGDICIALECGADEVLLTTDASFELLCPALGLKYERV